MSKLLKRKIAPGMNYSDMLASYSVADLKLMAGKWQIKGISKLKKDDLVEEIYKTIQEKLDEVLFTYNLDHFSIVTELVKGNNVFSRFPIAAEQLIQLGLIIEASIDGEMQIILPDLVRSKMQLFYEEYNHILTYNTLLKDYMELTVSLYGVVTEEFVVDGFFAFNDGALTKESIKSCLFYSSEATRNVIVTDGFVHYYRLAEFEKVYQDIMTKDEIPYKLITHELFEYFIQNNNTLWKETVQKLYNLLHSKLGFNYSQVEESLDEYRVMLSYNHGVSDFIQLFSKKHEQADMVTLKEFAELIIALNSEMNHWELKGNSPMDLSIHQKQMPIVKGEKIGRNDPCPCGSGKKYKKCCM